MVRTLFFQTNKLYIYIYIYIASSLVILLEFSPLHTRNNDHWIGSCWTIKFDISFLVPLLQFIVAYKILFLV